MAFILAKRYPYQNWSIRGRAASKGLVSLACVRIKAGQPGTELSLGSHGPFSVQVLPRQIWEQFASALWDAALCCIRREILHDHAFHLQSMYSSGS